MKLNNLKLIIPLALILVFLLYIFYPTLPYRIGGDGYTEGVRLFRDSGELQLYFLRSAWVQENLIPYRDTFVEYPALGAAYIAWPRIFTHDFLQYERLFVTGNALLFLLFVFFTFRLLKKLGQETKKLWLLFLPSSLYFSLFRFDVLPALIIQAGIFFLFKKKHALAILLLIISGLVKWYAFLFLPLFFYWILKNETYKGEAKKLLLYLSFFSLALFFLGALIFGHGLFDPYEAQLAFRTIEPGSIHYIIGSIIFSFLPFCEKLLKVILPVFQFALPLIWLIFGWRLKERLGSKRDLIAWLCLTVMLFTFFAKFYSPQWHIWFLPLLILLPLSKRFIFFLAFHDIITFITFPILRDTVGNSIDLFHIFIFVRTLILLLLAVWLYRDYIKKESPSRDPQITPP